MTPRAATSHDMPSALGVSASTSELSVIQAGTPSTAAGLPRLSRNCTLRRAFWVDVKVSMRITPVRDRNGARNCGVGAGGWSWTATPRTATRTRRVESLTDVSPLVVRETTPAGWHHGGELSGIGRVSPPAGWPWVAAAHHFPVRPRAAGPAQVPAWPWVGGWPGATPGAAPVARPGSRPAGPSP